MILQLNLIQKTLFFKNNLYRFNGIYYPFIYIISKIRHISISNNINSKSYYIVYGKSQCFFFNFLNQKYYFKIFNSIHISVLLNHASYNT